MKWGSNIKQIQSWCSLHGPHLPWIEVLSFPAGPLRWDFKAVCMWAPFAFICDSASTIWGLSWGKKVTSAYNFVSCLFFLAEGYLMDSLTCQIIWLLSVSIISTNFSSPLFLLTEKFWCLVCLAFLTLRIYLKYPGLFPFLQSLFPLPSPSFPAPWFSSLFQNYWEGS